MHSSTGGDASSAAAPLDSAFSMPPDHSTAAWEKQAQGRDKIDRDRFISAKREWSAESRSSYRSSGLLASGSLTASFSKRKVIGRNEAFENGRNRSVVGRSESSTSLQSPTQTGRDAGSPGYGSSPNVERSSKPLDGHHCRDARFSPASLRPLSSPHIDSRLHGNHNESEVLGAWERERSRFSSPPNGWDVANRGRDYRERSWSRPDYRRPCPLPKLDSSKEWSQSDRELLEGRIDRYSSVAGREMAFSEIASANNRESSRNDWKARDRVLQSGLPTCSSVDTLYNRDTKFGSFVPDAGVVSPPQQSPLQSSFSHDSDLDAGPASKKRPRLTWGQGLAKYEKEKTGDELSSVKKLDDGSVYGSVLHSDGSIASVLPEDSMETSNAVSCREETHRHVDDVRTSDMQLDDFTIPINIEKLPLLEAVVSRSSDSGGLVLQYMQAFIDRYHKEMPNLSKEILTQHVEKVEFEIDRLEKELAKLDNKLDGHRIYPETSAPTINVHSNVMPPKGALVPGSPDTPCMESPCHVDSIVVATDSLAESDCKEVLGLVDVAGSVQDPLHEADTAALDRLQITGQSISGSYIPPQNDSLVHLESLKKFDINALGEVRDSVASTLSSNQEIARASTAALAHLHATGVGTELHDEGFSWNRQGNVWWKQNVERHDERIQKLLELKIAEERSSRRFTEGVLAIQFRAKREAWKQEFTRTLSKDIVKEKNGGGWEPGSSRQLPSNFFSFAEPCVEDASKVAIQAVEKCLVDSPFDTVREYLRMPLMLLGQKERVLHRFDSMNGLVENPIAAELERKAMNPWSLEERRIFLEKYSLLGKNLRKIASYLEHKTVADCVQFFYLNQKTEEFEKIHRRHQLKKRREARSSAFYLATATSASRAVGLHLVADAAAAASAMSVPRSIRSLGSTSSRACRDSVMVKQASAASILIAKDSSYEPSCFQNPQGPPYRTPKKPHEEVVQWKSQWNDKERELFVNAVAMYGKDFDCISAYVGSKSAGQCKAYFGKARKRLGLDQLVEHQREVYLNTRQQDDQLVNSTKSESHLDIDLDRKMGDVTEQQLKLERSPTHANPCPAPEAHGDFPCENQRFELVSAVSSSKSLKADEDIGSVVLSENAGPAVVDTQWAYLADTNAEASCSLAKFGIAPLVTVQGCAKDKSAFGMASQIKLESRSLRSETFVASSSAVGISHSISSHGSPSPTAVSAPILHVGESVHVKEKPVKTTEAKARREPTSWTQEEKEKFVDILKIHGKDWELLRKNLPAKSLIQIKTYFQNSKAKLGLGSESSLGTSGRAGSSWKRKVDDSDSSNNTGSGSQILPQKLHATLDEGKLKANASMVAAPGGPASSVLSPEALAYANIFGRKLLEDSLNAQKVFNAMGLAPNASAPGILPMLSSGVFSSPSLVSVPQSYLPTASASMQKPQGLGHHQLEQSSMMVMEPSSSAGVQAHQSQPQQPVASTGQDFSVPGVPLGCNKQPVQLDQPPLLQQAPPPSQQWQQVAEAVLQQLLPQAVQRHQQQLQLAGQQIPHHFQQVLSHPQVQQNWPGQSQVGSGAIPASIVSSHNTHGKLHALLQQHQQPQLNQIQLLQLQRQQQQQQQQLLLHLQQAQALSQPHQMQNHALLVQQKHNFASEQQQPALLRGFVQVPNASVEGFKQNDVDIRILTMSQQAASGNVHQLLVSNQASDTSSQLQAVSEAQLPASDVKLFGQSLLSQPLSGNQNLTAKFSASPSPAGPAISVTPGMITGTRLGSSTTSNRPRDHGFQGQGWQQSTTANAHCNGSSRSNLGGAKEVGSLSAQERVSCSVERLNMDGANNKDGRAVDGKVLTMSCLPDDNDTPSGIACLDKGIISSVSSFSCGLSTASLSPSGSQMSGQVVNIDNNITPSMNRKDLALVSGSTPGDSTASQGLPRVLDAFAALAEWRLQNSSGGLTDEFLSQFWEALQKNPGSLIEAGRASGSLSQLYSEGPQMLQHLRERLLSSHSEFGPLHSGAGGARGPDVESVRLSSNGQKLPSLAFNTCGNEGGLACSDELVKMETDGSGGAHG